MFLGRNELKLTFGVDLEIGKTYVDRSVPQDNLYWTDRKLYIPPMSGYLFMPIFADLAYRCGLSKTQLLSEAQFTLAEAILQSAMKLELQQIDWNTHVDECLEISAAGSRNPVLLEDLRHYFAGKPAPSGLQYGTPFPSLNRADTYLFYLVPFSFDQDTHAKLLNAWYAMITYFLVMDDLADIRKDLEAREENAFVDAGLTEEGIARVIALVDLAHDKMMPINPVLANRIDYKRSTMDIRAAVLEIIGSVKGGS